MKKTKLMFFLAMFAMISSFFIIEANEVKAQKLGQVYMRGHYARQMSDRSEDFFTGAIPALGLEGIEDRDGYGIATGVNIMVAPKDPWLGQEVWGEVGLEYSRFGDSDRGTNATRAIELLHGLNPGSVANKSSDQSEISVSIFNVHIGPKLRFNFGDPEPDKLWTWKRLHPYMVMAMMFGVISPPSDDVTYIDIGALLVGGFDYVLPPLGGLFSIGMDYRHHFFGNATGEDIDYGSAGVFFTVNF